MLSTIFYNDTNTDTEINGVGFHKVVLNTIEYFKCAHTYQDSLEFKMSVETAKLFKKWLYEQEISKDELNLEIGIEIYNISDFLDIKFYIDIKNKLAVYVLETNNPDIQFKYFLNMNDYDVRFNFGEYHVKNLDKQSWHYAFCLRIGIGCKKDEKKAFEIFELNWKKNNCPYSLHNYAFCIQKGMGCEKDEKKAFELYELNWKENNCCYSLYQYAYCFQNGIGCIKDKKKAFELHELNWTENKYCPSLHGYIGLLNNRSGSRKGFELYELNWKENKHINSLNSYIWCLISGIGCEKNEKEAFELAKSNYKESISILKTYILLLQKGVGCEEDKEEAFELAKIYSDKSQDILELYISFLHKGIGCEENIEEADRLENNSIKVF